MNVLVALFDDGHPHHEAAHRWFGRNRKRGWATCPMTVCGSIRVLGNPAYGAEATPEEVASRLRNLCSAPDHHFWPDSVPLTDDRLFRLSPISGHRQLTDVCLLGLAVRTTAGLPRSTARSRSGAVAGASPGSMVVLGP